MLVVIDSTSLLVHVLQDKELLRKMWIQEKKSSGKELSLEDLTDLICYVKDNNEHIIYKDNPEISFYIDDIVSELRRYGVTHRLLAETVKEQAVVRKLNTQFPELTNMEVILNEGFC